MKERELKGKSKKRVKKWTEKERDRGRKIWSKGKIKDGRRQTDGNKNGVSEKLESITK